METMLGILFFGVAAACTAAYLAPSPAERRTRKARTPDREREREAHYMRNFWEYDGGVQEEFEE